MADPRLLLDLFDGADPYSNPEEEFALAQFLPQSTPAQPVNLIGATGELPQLSWQQQQPIQQMGSGNLTQRIQELLGAKEPDQGGTVADILSSRFGDSGGTSYGDYAQGIVSSALGKPALGQQFTDSRMAGMMKQVATISEMERQRQQMTLDGQRFALQERQFEENARHNRETERRLSEVMKLRANNGAGTRKLSATEQKELFETDDVLSASTGAVSALQRAQELIGGAPGSAEPYSGFLAETRADLSRLPFIGDLIADKERGAATTEYRTLVMEQALNNLKAIFGGMPTEGERQVLLQMQALPNYTPQEQQRIINNAITAANKRLQFNKGKRQSILTGDYGAVDPMEASVDQVDGLTPEEQQELQQLRARFGK